MKQLLLGRHVSGQLSMGQNEGNEIYSLSAGYSGTGKRGWFRNRRSYHWLREIGG